MKRRYDYLTIGMLCLALALLVLAGIARAETTIYATLTGEGAGYDTGYGVSIEHTTAQWNHLALHGLARAAWQDMAGAATPEPSGWTEYCERENCGHDA